MDQELKLFAGESGNINLIAKTPSNYHLTSTQVHRHIYKNTRKTINVIKICKGWR